jgi:hypothetical protein
MVTDRQKYIIQFLWRFGASRAEDIPMRFNGQPPTKSEMAALENAGLVRDRVDRDAPGSCSVYWELTEAGIKEARS